MHNMIHISQKENVAIVSFDNDTKINASISPNLKSSIIDLFQSKPQKLIFDLTHVKFIDSAGFGALISILKIAQKENASFVLCCLSPEVADLMEIMQLDKVFDIFQNLEQAL